MRSSKSRSRSKSNRQRSPMGNIVNRVFDSSGPEGKVRGTPQQIIDKYLALARDAQLSNDRVAAENFLQHAEHYARMLGEAQRELEAMRAQQGGGEPRGDGGDEELRGERREPFRDEPRNGQRDEHRNGQRDGGRPRDERPRDERARDERPRDGRRPETVVEVIDFGEPADSGLVDTPEARAASAAGPAPAPQEGQREGTSRRGRRQRGERPGRGAPDPAGSPAEAGGSDAAPEASEAAE
ncbi:MAG: DUF4167 domain-containing protein [Rhodobacteraceae bacterium]|nr:DUF4167 domain-containing protein [Paracoccaceae bacterium]